VNTVQLLLLIAQAALTILAQQKVGGAVPQDIEVLLDIISKALAAYQAQTGQPLDPNLIKPYVPIP
jgi:hypothetical protein